MIRIERRDDTAIVTVDRPGARNALDRASMARLDEIARELEGDATLAAAVLTGAGGAFVAGGDLRDLAALTTGAEGRAMSEAMQATLARWAALPFPTIAAIDGDAYGGGCEVALACDLRVMAGHARLVWKQVAMGLMPGWGGGQRLQRLVGPARALRWLVTGAAVDAEEARAAGLADAIAGPTQTALDVALAMAAAIGAAPRGAVRAVKRALREGADLPLAGGIALEAKLFETLWGQPDHQRAVQAFLARKG